MLQSWLFWLVVFLTVRLCLPFAQEASGPLYDFLDQGLATSRTWASQALVSSWEMPLLPTLMVLAGKRLSAGGIDGLHALVALCQFTVLWRATLFWHGSWRRPAAFLGFSAAVLLLPDLRALWALPTPAWLGAALFVAMLGNLASWFRSGELRDLLGCSIRGAFLLLCGIPEAIASIGALAFMAARLARRQEAQGKQGHIFLLLAPFAYAFILILAWNWLFLGDPLYCFRDLLAGPGAATWNRLLGTTFGASVLQFAVVVAAAAVWNDPDDNARRTAAGLVLALLLASIVLPYFGFRMADPAWTLLPALSATALVVFLGAASTPARPWPFRIQAATLAGFALLSCALPAASPTQPAGTSQPPPPPTADLLSKIDSRWQDSRLYIVTLRAAMAYPDPHEKRFLPLTDLRLRTMLEHLRHEQLYVLLPPNNGLYYAPSGFLAHLHESGHPALLLEESWPGGWQLWRGVRAPQPGEEPPLQKP